MLRKNAPGEAAIQLELQGDVDPAFAPVADVFREGFEAGREVGACVAVLVDGVPVVDIWAGYQDRRKTQPWERDTLCALFSSSKGIVTICMLQALAEGAISLDEPIAECWPEFAAAGKEAVTTRQVLNHRSGVVAFHEPAPPDILYDWTAMCAALAAERPWWAPGTRHGYHARTFGFLLGEVLRRSTGMTLRQWLKDRIAGPLGLDLHFGLDSGDLQRCAQMVPARLKAGAVPPASARPLLAAMADRSTATGSAFQNPALGPGYMNSAQYRTAEMPGMNGFGTARSLARLYAEVSAAVPATLLEQATATESAGMDEVLKSYSRFGLGFMLYDERAPIGAREGSYGHAGAGGSMAFHDPSARVAFCFLMNQMQQGVVTGGTSAMACAKAVYACLEGRGILP
jgi:CubicO group peptidase (beta-lactamase class C family)